MSRKVICYLMSFIILCNVLPITCITVGAEEMSKIGYIEVLSDIDNNERKIKVLNNEGTIFALAEDISLITGYDLEIGDHINYSKAGGMDVVTAVDIEFDGTVSAMGKNFKVHIVNHEDRIYLPLSQMLYLLHAQWWISDMQLVVKALPKTLIDFLGESYSDIIKNQVNQTDLLINGESKLGHSMRTSLAAVFNDFDPRIFVLWWPEEGFIPILNKEWEEALLQIAVNDMEFLDTYGQKAILSSIEENGYASSKANYDDLKNIIDLPINLVEGTEDIDELINWLSKESKTNNYLKSNKYFDFSYINIDELKELSEEIQGVSNTLEFMDIVLNMVEISQRSKKWGEQYINQISILTDFDDTGYNTSITDRVKKVASGLMKEHQNSFQAASNEAVLQLVSLAASKIFDKSVFGKYYAVFDTGFSIAKITNINVKEDTDAADLAYMVDCLVKIEQIAMREMSRSYNKLLSNDITGDFTQADLERLRNCTMLSVRTNLRNRTFLYYLNARNNNNWEGSVNANIINQQIINDYAMVCMLMETENSDQLLFLDDFDNMYSDKSGIVRQNISMDIFQEGEIPITAETIYSDILDMFYYKISNGWNGYEEVSYLFNWPYTEVKTLSDAGYTFIDLDNDGVLELLVTSVEAAVEGMIYDLYTFKNGTIIHLATSGERYRYYLCDDNTIYYEGSGGAMLSSFKKYMIDDNKDSLRLEEIVLYDGYADEKNPWYYGKEDCEDEINGYNVEFMKHITEIEALNIINGYQTTDFQLNLFDSYSPHGVEPVDYALKNNFELAVDLENIIYFICDDFDGNGTLEGFGITGDNDEYGYNLENVKIYHIENGGLVSCIDEIECLYGYGSDYFNMEYMRDYIIINADNAKFFVLGGIDGQETWLYGIKDNKAYQPQISGQYASFDKIDNGLYCGKPHEGGEGYYQHYYEYDSNSGEFIPSN
jgi:hypothetical protein